MEILTETPVIITDSARIQLEKIQLLILKITLVDGTLFMHLSLIHI